MRFWDDLRFGEGHGRKVHPDGDLQDQEGEVADHDLQGRTVGPGGEQTHGHGASNLR